MDMIIGILIPVTIFKMKLFGKLQKVLHMGKKKEEEIKRRLTQNQFGRKKGKIRKKEKERIKEKREKEGKKGKERRKEREEEESSIWNYFFFFVLFFHLFILLLLSLVI